MITIRFEDHGQDFLEWDIDSKGIVVDSRPFQAFVWCGGKVTNHARLQIGGKAKFKPKSWNELLTIRYPLIAVIKTTKHKRNRK